MAAIDLYGNDAGQIRSAYQTHLGRDASNDEVSGWLSGTYGGGGLNDWLSQIQNSGEAKRRAPVVGQNPNVSTAQTRGTDDPYWTQPAQPGIGTPESGFGWGGVENPWYQASHKIGDAYTQYLGRSASPDEVSKWLSGGYGYGTGPGSADAFVNAIRAISGYQAPAGTGTTPTSGPPGGNYQAWIGSLLQGASSPDALLRLESTLNQQGIRLQKDSAGNVRGRLYLPDGKTVDVVNQWGQPWTWIDRGAGGPSNGGVPQTQMPGSQYSDPYTKALEQMMSERIASLQSGQDQGYQQLMAYLQQRFQDLQGPGRTGAENEVIRTQALDPIEQDRAAARRRVMDRLSARGLTLDSGIAQQALLEVDKAFDAMRATSQNVLAVNELNRREGRNQSAEDLAMQLYAIPQARTREALGYAGALSDLGPQRLQLAMQAAGMGGNPSSMFQNLMQLAGLNQNASLYGAQDQQALWSGLGSLAAMLAQAGR